MADAKISQLPVATTPLAGTELVPLVQGGVNVQSTVDKVLTGTVPSGTANGVLFLNGSKVVTSGSALTFDGTTVGVFGGTTVNYRFNANRGTDDTSQGLRFGYGGIDAYRTNQLLSAPMTSITLTQTGSDGTRTGYELNSSGQSVWSVAGSEQMRLDSTGLGIGTSSPATKLHIDTANAGYGLTLAASSLTARTYRFGLDANANLALFDSSAAAVRLTLDTSGNLGLGVTPSAWGSGKAIELGQVTGNALWGLGINSLYLTSNARWDGSNYVYTNNGAANLYGAGTGNGSFTWFTAPSGTAGNAISFTQAMTLDASGNLLVGTTSDADGSALQVDSNGALVYTALFSNSSTSTNIYNVVRLTQGAAGSAIGMVGIAGSSVANVPFRNTFYVGTQNNNSFILVSNDNERARIPAAGGMVVGTAALATTATDGFLYVPTCAGTPTGTPTTQTGTAPIVVDTTNNKLYFYSGGQWRDAGP